MLAQDLELTIHSLLNTVNDKELLSKILGLLQQKNVEEDSDIVGYTIDEKPLRREQYNTLIDEANARMDAGHYITHEDLCNEDWDQ